MQRNMDSGTERDKKKKMKKKQTKKEITKKKKMVSRFVKMRSN